jgi:hypothetical protein
VKQSPYYFEIKDMLTQFVTAFDDVVIKRFNVNRKPEDRIAVRYLYSPKQRVLYDIVNTAQNMTLPAIAITIASIERDNDRVFNKLDGFYYSDGSNKKSAKLRPPVPINISVNMSIITRFQTDMDQILSNFIPYSNPYVVISWKVPTEFNLPSLQEIRSEVLWSGTMKMEYPIDLNGQEKARVLADTTFTIKGWLFKEQVPAVGNIYYIDNNFHVESLLTGYSDLSSTETYPPSTGLYNETESVYLSGSPGITNVYFDSVLMDSNISLDGGKSGTVLLIGNNYNLLDGLLLSASNNTLFPSVTSVNLKSTNNPVITGYRITDYTVIDKNFLTFKIPSLYPNFRYPDATMVIVPYNQAGFVTSAKTYSLGNTLYNTKFIYGDG